MKPKYLIVHCSASNWGDAKAINEWHKQRNFSQIGYHAVLLNGHRTYASKYSEKLDGKIEPGRTDSTIGAHCQAKGMNLKSLGVCLIGIPGWGGYPSKKQIGALIHWLAVKCRMYGIPVENIKQHSDFEPKKPSCASLDMGAVRLNTAAKLKTM